MSQTTWVHGTSVQASNANDANFVERHGSGARIKRGGEQWFHFSIPTEVNKHITLVSIDTSIPPGFWITRLHVYHGHFRVARFDKLNLSGGRMNETFKIPGETKVNRGIGISIKVESDPDEVSGGLKLEFHAVGATFS